MYHSQVLRVATIILFGFTPGCDHRQSGDGGIVAGSKQLERRHRVMATGSDGNQEGVAEGTDLTSFKWQEVAIDERDRTLEFISDVSIIDPWAAGEIGIYPFEVSVFRMFRTQDGWFAFACYSQLNISLVVIFRTTDVATVTKLTGEYNGRPRAWLVHHASRGFEGALGEWQSLLEGKEPSAAVRLKGNVRIAVKNDCVTSLSIEKDGIETVDPVSIKQDVVALQIESLRKEVADIIANGRRNEGDTTRLAGCRDRIVKLESAIKRNVKSVIRVSCGSIEGQWGPKKPLFKFDML